MIPPQLIPPAVLQEAIENLGFVPFVGAGASASRPNSSDLTTGPWSSFAIAAQQLLAGFPQDSPERKYLLSILQINSIPTEALRNTPAVPSTPSREPIIEFQDALIRVASALTGEYGRQLERITPAYPSTYGPSVVNSHDRDGEIRVSLSRAVRVSRTLAGPTSTPPTLYNRLYPPSFLEEKLVALGWLLFQGGPEEDAWTSEFSPRPPVAKSLSPGAIRLDELSWLADIIWLGLRLPVLSYPTSTELATVLSLRASEIGPRSGELAIAADFPIGEDPVTLVADWLRYCQNQIHREPTSPASTPLKEPSLHIAIAGALIKAYELNLAELKRGQKLGSGFPVALTTNYDRELELAFEDLREDYHVLYPALGKHKEGDAESEGLLWLMKTVTFGSRGPHPVTITIPSPEEKEPSCELHGPIIIKLHGSPLDELPKEGESGNYEIRSLSVVLSETEYLANIVADYGEGPSWLSPLLRAKPKGQEKLFFFLGYSVSDWNVRIRLFQQSTTPKEAALVAQRHSVNRPMDPYKAHILHKLKFHLHDQELDAFADALLSTPAVKSVLQEAGYHK